MKSAGKHLVLGLIWCFLRTQPCLCDVTVCVNDDRFIVVTATPAVITAGFELTSAGGHLIPIPPGNLTAPATPFTFLLSNTSSQVTWSSLGTTVTLDGDWVTPVGHNGQVNPVLDLSINYARGNTPVSHLDRVTGYCAGTGTLQADFNLDGVVDRLDIDLLGSEIGDKTNDAAFDLTSDQLVNQDDVDRFLGGNVITDGNKLNGDADFDGTVAFSDFLIFSSNFGQHDKKWSEGDFIANGRVEFDDFLVFASNFGESAASITPVPEPPTGIMLLVGLFCGPCRRRRAR